LLLDRHFFSFSHTEPRLTSQHSVFMFGITNMKTAANVDAVDLMFRAFSDRNRLRILHLLRKGEMCVGDIVEILAAPQPRVSRHLAYLRKAQLVEFRKVKRWAYYSLAPATTAFHRNLIHCLSNCFRNVPELKADADRADQLRKRGGCC
jgi:ArsR family transcriptional regulator, arsenate/arsenite/antimonite-responsive transcriptional repressor